MHEVYIHFREWVHVHNTTWFFFSLFSLPTHFLSSIFKSLFPFFILIIFSSCLWHIMFTFIIGTWHIYMTHLKSFYFLFFSPLVLGLLNPFPFTKDHLPILFPCSILLFWLLFVLDLIQMRDTIWNLRQDIIEAQVVTLAQGYIHICAPNTKEKEKWKRF